MKFSCWQRYSKEPAMFLELFDFSSLNCLPGKHSPQKIFSMAGNNHFFTVSAACECVCERERDIEREKRENVCECSVLTNFICVWMCIWMRFDKYALYECLCLLANVWCGVFVYLWVCVCDDTDDHLSVLICLLLKWKLVDKTLVDPFPVTHSNLKEPCFFLIQN